MIRLYGTTLENGSYARVTAGMRAALEVRGVLAGFVPVDAYDPEAEYSGWDADVAVYIGRQAAISLMNVVGDHDRRYVLLPPNSTWVPEELLDHVAKNATHVLAPSAWAEQMLWHPAEAHGLKTSLWLHGIDVRVFRPDLEATAKLLKSYAGGSFYVLHMTSTEAERKGTRELAEAWASVVRQGKLGSDPRLVVLGNPYEGGRLKEEVDRVVHDVRPTVQWIARGSGMAATSAAHFYQMHHVVCQPSRGEGFGLCPLEARACGVPIVATDCTGHGAHVHAKAPGVVVVPTGELAPIDDGPGALAPALSVDAIAESLVEAHDRWPSLLREAQQSVSELHAKWDWTAVTDDWLRRNLWGYVQKLKGAT